MKGSLKCAAVRICPQFLCCSESISKNAFRWFESGYRPEKNEIVRCTMKSERGSGEIFGVSPQMKLNQPPSPAERQISSRSDFIHRRWISSAIGGFSCKKHLLAQVLFSVMCVRFRCKAVCGQFRCTLILQRADLPLGDDGRLKGSAFYRTFSAMLVTSPM